jgi:L-2,4-diaminobutyrate decarboxylase
LDAIASGSFAAAPNPQESPMPAESQTAPAPRFAPDAADLREAGHALIERMARYLEGVGEGPVSTPLAPRAIARRFAAPMPRAGREAAAVWDEVWSSVAGDAIRLHHPMYMGHQVAPALPHAVLADAMVSLLNQSVAVWEMSPTGTFVEAQVVGWLREALGFPSGADGTLVSGGSAANLTGLLAAREARFPGSWAAGARHTPGLDRAALLVAGQAHYSIERAAGVMGLGSDAVVTVAEREGRMDARALAHALSALRDEGRIPLAVVATAGSTATGAFDPIDEIADVAAREGVWLHVDGAHGASFLISERLRDRLRGIERADSVAWDPHKMMWMPISLGAVFVRDRRHLDAAFQQSAPYLFHPQPGEPRSHDAGMRTLQCSRRLDALKLWVCLQHYGADHFAAMMERTVEVTAYLHDRLTELPEWEPRHRPDANILCFRHLPARVAGADAATLDGFQAELRARYNASGRGWITSTVLDGRRVLRVTIINPATGEAHVERMLEGLREVAGEG